MAAELSREHALAHDADDPLAGFRDRFVNEDSERIYLDGNSLGRLPLATRDRLAAIVAGSLAAAGFALLASMKLVAAELATAFRLGGGAASGAQHELVLTHAEAKVMAQTVNRTRGVDTAAPAAEAGSEAEAAPQPARRHFRLRPAAGR